MENEKLIQAIRAIVREEIRSAMAPANEEYMSVKQAAEYTNYAVDTLYTYAHKRVLESINKGNKLLFRKSDLDAWLNKKKSVVHVAQRRLIRSDTL